VLQPGDTSQLHRGAGAPPARTAGTTAPTVERPRGRVRVAAVPAGELTRPVSWHGTYPPADSSASLARLEAAGALTRAGVRGEVLDDAKTVVAELIANAIVHAGTPFTVAVDADATSVRVDVYDGSPSPPHFLGPPGTWPGFGLHIVAALSTAWGWQRRANGPGKIVWAQIERVRTGHD